MSPDEDGNAVMEGFVVVEKTALIGAEKAAFAEQLIREEGNEVSCRRLGSHGVRGVDDYDAGWSHRRMQQTSRRQCMIQTASSKRVNFQRCWRCHGCA
jgi:hypothetical protein